MANASCNLSAAFGKPVLDAIQPMPFVAMQSLLGPSFPDGNHNYWKSTLQRQLTDDAIVAIVEHANRMAPLSRLSCWSTTAAPLAGYPTMPPHFRIAISRGISCFSLGGPSRPRRRATATGLDPAKKFFDRFLRTRISLSALDVESEDVIKTAFGANLPRLAAIKEKYDATNFFRVNYNIKPRLAVA